MGKTAREEGASLTELEVRTKRERDATLCSSLQHPFLPWAWGGQFLATMHAGGDEQKRLAFGVGVLWFCIGMKSPFPPPSPPPPPPSPFLLLGHTCSIRTACNTDTTTTHKGMSARGRWSLPFPTPRDPAPPPPPISHPKYPIYLYGFFFSWSVINMHTTSSLLAPLVRFPNGYPSSVHKNNDPNSLCMNTWAYFRLHPCMCVGVCVFRVRSFTSLPPPYFSLHRRHGSS